MNTVKILTLVCVGALGAMLPQAKADEWNQKTVFTFATPVEIPGKVLEPGTYVFKLVDSPSDRNIVQVYNQRENHLYGTFLAIANYRLKTTGKTILTFKERAAGAPEAVRAWFYPGENYGHEFVYHKVKAMELAKANSQTVASIGTETSASEELKQAPLKAETSAGEEVEMSQAYPPASTEESAAAPTPAPAETPAPPAEAERSAEPAPAPEPAPAQEPAQLPQTGSYFPLLGLIGLVSLATAGVLRFATARSK